MKLTIKKQSLNKQAAEAIRQQILSAAFPPGFRLVETWLAEQFGLSRGTIRAALSELAHEGLVTQVAYTKWIVTELSGQAAWELFTLRSALEGLGARLAAEKITSEGSELLSTAYKELIDAASRGDRAAVTDADFALHKLIIELAGHRKLADQYRLIEQQVRLLIASSNALLPAIDEIIGQHEPIVDAILAGQGANAEHHIRHHNLSEGEVYAAHFRDEAAAASAARSPAPAPEPARAATSQVAARKPAPGTTADPEKKETRAR
jgi:DNA-binding GntR family transcriptional regulator